MSAFIPFQVENRDVGLVLEDVHKVMTFDQSPWLSPYVDENTEARRKATNPFEASIAKLRVRLLF